MKITLSLLVIPIFWGLASCSLWHEDIELDPEHEVLADILKEELHPLPKNPLKWEDSELQFLDQVTDKSVLALGESTHGTAQFFQAKHRIFKYLVENHDYRIFAFEADFGESLLLNEAVQEGRAEDIEALMKSEMHFWTWKTEEVKELLEWMCSYNKDREDEDKIHYMGVDCQFNTFHPDMVLEYLERVEAPFLGFAESELKEVRSLTENKFPGYTEEDFNNYLYQLDSIQDLLDTYEAELIQESSEKEYQLYARILRVVRQVSQVQYANKTNDYTTNYRDMFMAENIRWLLSYFDMKKIVFWAHNGHIANSSWYGSQGSAGHHLYINLGGDYAAVGFLFSQGTFTAVGQEGDNFTGLAEQTLDTIPQANSLNAIMAYTREAVFAVRIGDLMQHNEWYSVLNGNALLYFQMGAVYNNRPGDYYSRFNSDYFDYLIYFDKSTASVQLE